MFILNMSDDDIPFDPVLRLRDYMKAEETKYWIGRGFKNVNGNWVQEQYNFQNFDWADIGFSSGADYLIEQENISKKIRWAFQTGGNFTGPSISQIESKYLACIDAQVQRTGLRHYSEPKQERIDILTFNKLLMEKAHEQS